MLPLQFSAAPRSKPPGKGASGAMGLVYIKNQSGLHFFSEKKNKSPMDGTNRGSLPCSCLWPAGQRRSRQSMRNAC